jgi:arylsulfatase
MAWEWSGNKAYREGDMKVVWDKLVKEWELYDLSTDRAESVNLAKSQPETTHRLIKAWHDWAARTGTRIR